jgi:Arc-like DNA binding domain
MARPIANLRLRLPETLRRKLATEAEKSQRSLNSEILWRLGHSLGAEGAALVQEYETLDQQVKRKLNEILEKMLAERRGGA